MEKDKVILVVDDDPTLCQAVALVLEEAGYPVQAAFDGAEALQLLAERPFHLILADIEMPNLNGYQLLQAVRQNPMWQSVPLVFLSGRKFDSDIRFGKQLGVDDYLVKPLSVPDLLATVEGKLLRFCQPLPVGEKRPFSPPQPSPAPHPGRLTIGSLSICPAQHRVWVDNKPITLSAREFALLHRLAREAGNVVAPQELAQATHELTLDEQEAGGLIRPLIRSLRHRLGNPTLIENIRGVGYRLLPTP